LRDVKYQAARRRRGSIIEHCIYSIVEKSTWQWYFERKTKERFCSSHTSHSVKGNSIESASFFVLAFEEKKVEGLHLVARFSPTLGFLGYILCLFLDGV
jgi:hypothetical protein